MIDRQLKYFQDNQKAFVEKYSGKFLVISEELKMDVFNSLESAYSYGVEHYGLGNFLLKDCNPNYVGKVQIISPTIVFA